MRNCYSTGTVTKGTTASVVGTIIGLTYSATNVNSNYFLAGAAANGIGDVDPSGNTSTASPSDSGTTAASAENLKLSGTYTGWDFSSNKWILESGVNGDYPTLKYVPILAVTASASSITLTCATSGGNVISDGYGTITQWGVEYRKSTQSAYTTINASSGGTTNYTIDLTGLTPNTQYIVRAFAANEAGTAYGESASFSTLPTAPQLPVNIMPGSIINTTKATITGSAANKFVVNITDASVGYITTSDLTPTSGANFIDNYESGSNISTGVSSGKHLQVYDVGSDGKVVNFFEIKLGNQHIKRPTLSLPINEGFENSGAIPADWATAVVTPGTTNLAWTCVSNDTITDSSTITYTPHSGTYMLKANSWDADLGASGRISLVSGFDIPATGDFKLSFWMYHGTDIWGYGSTTDNIQPQISINSGSTWSDLGTQINQRSDSNGWIKHTIGLNAYRGNNNVQISLLATSSYGYNIYVDDVEIKQISSTSQSTYC